MPVGWADANHIGYPPHRHPGAVPQRHQLAATNEPFRYRLTACSGTRKERPTRIASSSPECTKRYTVIFDTRMIVATSATVRNLTSLRGVSPDMQLPLPHEAEHLTGFSAPVTYVSRVSPVRKRATPSKASLLLRLAVIGQTRLRNYRRQVICTCICTGLAFVNQSESHVTPGRHWPKIG